MRFAFTCAVCVDNEHSVVRITLNYILTDVVVQH